MKLNVNIFNELNGSFEKEFKTKKQVIIEGNKVTTEDLIKEAAPQPAQSGNISPEPVVNQTTADIEVKDEVKPTEEDKEETKEMNEVLTADDYSKPVKVNGKWFRYNYKYNEVEYLTHGSNESSPVEVVDSVGLSKENWENRATRNEYLSGWSKELDDEAERLAGDILESAENEKFYQYVKGLLDAGAIDDPKYYNSLSDKEKDELIRDTYMKDPEIKKDFESLNEEETIKIPNTEEEPDYIISDVTVIDQISDGDVQAPDIDGLLTLVSESLTNKYGEWGKINVLSTNKLSENSSYALVDITTKELVEEFKNRGIRDGAIGKNLIIESSNGLIEFKVNNLNGTTTFSKKSDNPASIIEEWVESEFLSEAKAEKEKETEIAKAKNEKDTVEYYINNRLDLKMEIANIKGFIEMGKSIKDEGFTKMIQDRMYGFVTELPHSIEVTNKDDKYELEFTNADNTVEMIFGKEWVKEPTEDNKVVGIIKEGNLPNISKFIYDLDVDKGNAWSAQSYTKDGLGNKIIIVSKNGRSENTAEDVKKAVEEKYPKLKGEITENNNGIWFYLKESEKLTESYEQFNIGEIEVVFNPDTYETLYSIPSADVKDKKINLTKVPTVDTPYDTDTIIKSYVETKFGRIPTEEENKEPKEEVDVTDINVGSIKEPVGNTDIGTEDEELHEDELPEEPDTNELQNTPDTTDEVEEVQNETGTARFVKIRPKQEVDLSNVREKVAENNVPESSYIVVDTKDLLPEEWENLINNLNQEQVYLSDVKSLDRKNYSFNVIKLTSSGAGYSLLVDPLGYGYPRYVSIID